jgi:hypothetical protein
VLLTAVADLQAFYNPGTGRWLNRDPIGEHGGLNNYGVVSNCPVSRVDTDGRQGYSPWPGHPPITFPPKPPNPSPKPTLFYWRPTHCSSPLSTAFIQVGITPNGSFVDDGKHGVLSSKPKCPPLYPASDGSFFQDTPGSAIGWSPFLPHHIKFIVCRVCLEDCCRPYYHRRSRDEPPGRMWRIVSVGPCRVFHYPMLGGEFNLDDSGFQAMESPPPEFSNQVNASYGGVLDGRCFGCKTGKQNF